MLNKISIPIKSDTSYNNRKGFPTHRSFTFGLTRGRYSGVLGLSASSNKYKNMYEELQRIGNIICPFEFNAIHVNHNVTCPKHKDDKNVGNSLLVSFGEYTGSHIVIEGTGYETDCKPVVFNGGLLEHHNTEDLEGNKYSLVYYCCRVK